MKLLHRDNGPWGRDDVRTSSHRREKGTMNALKAAFWLD
jgi:hypothetical protein